MTAAIVANRAGDLWTEISAALPLGTASREVGRDLDRSHRDRSATGRADDPVTAELLRMLGWVALRAAAGDSADDASRIDRIALTERLKAALDAVQAVEMVAFARSQVAEQRRHDLDPAKVGRGIADQIALACKVSSTEGARRLRTARDLCLDLPGVFALLTNGDISGWTARLITGELAHLDRPTRRHVDTRLTDSQRVGGSLADASPRTASARARRLAYAADPAAAVNRCRTARNDRRVTLRPAPDTMSLLTGLLPVEAGVACLAALDRHATRPRAAGDHRSRGQIMADTLIERITGQATATDVPVEVQILMPLASLLDPDQPIPGELGDHGPLPAPLIRDILSDTHARTWWRRVFTRPTDHGQLIIGLDRRRRRFTGSIADLIRIRDRHCRDPHCDAPIRHLDHLIRHADGGSAHHDNGRGVCERHNYVRELPGWTVRLHDPTNHTIRTTTPTGHSYLSRPPEPP